MSNCPLTSRRLHLLVDGFLSEAEKNELVGHLETECPECQTALDEADMDEETLLLHLFAAGEEVLTPEQQKRTWANISQQWIGEEKQAMPEVRGPRPWSAARWLFGSGAVVAAAAFLLLVIPSESPQSDALVGIKGEAPLPRAYLQLRASSNLIEDTAVEGQVVDVTHGIEIPAHVTIFHWRQGKEPQSLFAGQIGASSVGRGQFPVRGGRLGFSFEDEVGVHLFVAVISESAINSSDLVGLLDPKWFSAPVDREERSVTKHRIAIEMIRIQVHSPEANP